MCIVRLNEPRTHAPTLESQFRFRLLGTVNDPPTDSGPWNWSSITGDLLSVFSDWPFNLAAQRRSRPTYSSPRLWSSSLREQFTERCHAMKGSRWR